MNILVPHPDFAKMQCIYPVLLHAVLHYAHKEFHTQKTKKHSFS